MLRRWSALPAVMAMLLALAVQLGLGAIVPRVEPLLQLAATQTLCHPGTPGQPQPPHPSECLLCAFCVAVHAPATMLAAATWQKLPALRIARAEAGLPPPARAPPSPFRPPHQPRAPPTLA